MKIFNPSTIFSQLLLYISVVALFPLLVVIFLIFQQAERSLQDQIISNLHSISVSRARQVEVYMREQYRAVKSLSQSPDTIAAFTAIEQTFQKKGFDPGLYSFEGNRLQLSDYARTDRKYRPFITKFLEEHSYEDLYLISMEGKIIFSVLRGADLGQDLKTGEWANMELAKVFTRAMSLLETGISNFGYYAPAGKHSGFIASPIFDGRKFIGVVAIRINNEDLYGIVNDYSGLQKTGETVVAAKVGDHAVFMAPLRFDPNAAFNKSIPLGSRETIPIQKAVQKLNGAGTLLDYQGREVLAHWTYLPSIRWGMVVKIDAEEAFRPIHRLENLSLLIGFLTILIIVAVTWYLAKSISRPLVQLTEVTRLVREGDLTQNVSVPSKNEIGQLSASFNTMIGKLHQSYSHLEEANLELKNRTEQLKAANIDLNSQIAERERVEKTLKIHSFELEQINRELEEFTYHASHDLKEPLRKIITFGDLLQSKSFKNNPEGWEYLEKMQTSAERMQKLIDDLLNYSKVTGRKQPFGRHDLQKIVDDVLHGLDDRIQETRAEIRVGSLPALEVDPIQIEQVFQNLLANSLKYYRKGSPPVIHIASSKNEESGEWKIAISDNGIGMDEKYLDRIFKPFERLHGKEEYEGTGIGLAICDKIIQRHSGEIDVLSQPGTGTTFVFTLPEKQLHQI